MDVIRKPNFIVLTGGPGGGKSSLGLFLQQKGYSFIKETARSIITDRIGQGMPPRPEPILFARQIFERDVLNFTSHSGSAETIFFDRSLLDSAAMIHEADSDAYEQVEPIVTSHRFNDMVFITPPWEDIYVNDDERDQTFGEAIVVYEQLHAWYRQHGYTVIELPKTTVELRAEFVLRKIDR